MSSFHEDWLRNEKKDPTESSNLKFVNVPLTLLAAFLGFGIAFLALRTDRVDMSEGDSRTHSVAVAPAHDPAEMDTTAPLAQGRQIFTTTCQACHQANGQGIPGTFPPLAGSEWVMGPAARTVAIILHGIDGEITVKGQKYRSVMPTFGAQLKPEEIAAVATFVRQHFGKTTDAVSPDFVVKVRGITKDQTGPWAGETALQGRKWE